MCDAHHISCILFIYYTSSYALKEANELFAETFVLLYLSDSVPSNIYAERLHHFLELVVKGNWRSEYSDLDDLMGDAYEVADELISDEMERLGINWRD